jgi:hypothetical protein
MALSKQLQRIHEAIMTIKQYGGVFGRNPTFNDVTIEGQLTFDGDIDINSDLKVSGDIETTGNVIIATSGKGIDFSATAGTGTSELFSDYEEGVHEAALVDDGAGATIAVSYNRLNYVKVGRLVQITGEVVISGITGTPSGDITVSLPFTGATSSERSAHARCYVAMSSLTGSPTGFGTGYIPNNGTTMALQTETAYAYGNIASNIQVGTTFVFNFSYQSA